MAAFWSSLRPVSPKTVNPMLDAVFTKPTIDGTAGKRWSWTQTSCSAGSKTKCMSATSMS